ncbi:hypothetical protein I602_822 [Polaribacter dokdonensis DSW-5]|uniref:Uncharacterized protein n=1 Tax=Polaribacter dokdonensis DSW-5 TaxID=1300348 RepID=A0A0M9CF55_9FLAO|nr:hypothetical protein I602_822 [Polaribacter dokdonensis DSW-5]
MYKETKNPRFNLGFLHHLQMISLWGNLGDFWGINFLM